MSRPRLLVSACLLGQRTRYDGRLKRVARVCALAPRYELIPVCPEVDCGLPTPRDPMRLETDEGGLRLRVIASGVDHTQRMADWIGAKLDEWTGQGVHGCILKSRSPSCGLTRVPRVTPDGMESGSGAGIFALALARRVPDLPVLEDDLLDGQLRTFEARLS